MEEIVFNNITTTAGRTAIAKALSGNAASLAEIQVNYGALGTGSTTPAIGDTTLVTESYRAAISSISYADNVFYGTMFYGLTDVSGTFEEHGLFINGTASADTGTLLCRYLLNGLVKSTSQTLTIETAITLNDA